MSDSIFRKDATAQGVAKQRLIETLAKPDKRVINDPYAGKFVLGASIIKLMGHKLSVWITKKFASGFHEHLISRTRFIDDLIENSASNEAEQYVILGAGYDLRAHRLDLPPTLKIFEVDQPEVQLRKRSKLPKNLPNSENITYVSVDFNHQTLKKQLLNFGFDQNKPTIFTLEGVSQYITKDAINSTLEDMAELTQKTSATFFISYVNKLLNENPQACFGKGYPKAAKKAETIKRLTAKFGEPWISFYSAEEIEDMLSQNGFSIIENKTLADLNSVYFTPVGRTLSEDQIFKLEHFVVAKSKTLITYKAKQYKLIFKLVPFRNEKIPIIECMTDEQGSSLNLELATFIQAGGVNYTKDIIAEVNDLDFSQSSENNFVHEIPSYTSECDAEFFASPNRASFWNGDGYTDIPVNDFVDILQEWIDFLNSLSFKHRLSKR